jgi:hypothetical protein
MWKAAGCQDAAIGKSLSDGGVSHGAGAIELVENRSENPGARIGIGAPDSNASRPVLGGRHMAPEATQNNAARPGSQQTRADPRRTISTLNHDSLPSPF